MTVAIDKKNMPAGRDEELEGALIGRFKLTKTSEDEKFIYFTGSPVCEK